MAKDSYKKILADITDLNKQLFIVNKKALNLYKRAMAGADNGQIAKLTKQIKELK